MARVKRGTIRARKRARVLKQTKGYLWGRKSQIKAAKIAILKAGVNAFRDRRKKKSVARAGWHIQIGAALKPFDISYSVFMGALKKKKIALNRKMLAQLAVEYPEVFKKVVELVK